MPPMNRRHFLAAVAAAALAASAAAAHEYTLGALAVGHPYAVETPATAKTGAGYLSGHQQPARPPTGCSPSAPTFPRAQIHAVGDRRPGRGPHASRRGARHPAGRHGHPGAAGACTSCSWDSTAPLAAGASIPATLVFERAGEIAVEFKVEPRAAGATARHARDDPLNRHRKCACAGDRHRPAPVHCTASVAGHPVVDHRARPPRATCRSASGGCRSSSVCLPAILSRSSSVSEPHCCCTLPLNCFQLPST